MADVPSVSDEEKERLLAEIGVEPSSIMIRRVEPAPAPPVILPPPAAPVMEIPASPDPWSGRLKHRRFAAALVMAVAGSAWTAGAMASGDPVATLPALLGLLAGAMLLLRPEKS